MEVKTAEKFKVVARGLLSLLALSFVNASDVDKRNIKPYFSPNGQLIKVDAAGGGSCLLMPGHEAYEPGVGYSFSNNISPRADLKVVSIDSPKVNCNKTLSHFLEFQTTSQLVQYLVQNPEIKITTSHSFNSPVNMNPISFADKVWYLSDQNQHQMKAEFLGNSEDPDYPELFFVVDADLTINGTSGAVGYIRGSPGSMHTTIFPNIS
ncbi:MAG: hypothetical protein WCK98_06785 [bacterium]